MEYVREKPQEWTSREVSGHSCGSLRWLCSSGATYPHHVQLKYCFIALVVLYSFKPWNGGKKLLVCFVIWKLNYNSFVSGVLRHHASCTHFCRGFEEWQHGVLFSSLCGARKQEFCGIQEYFMSLLSSGAEAIVIHLGVYR